MSSTQPVHTLWRATKAEIAELCRRYGQLLKQVPAGIDAAQLMWAFALTESYQVGETLAFAPRFEPAYFIGGRYCVGHQADNVARYGRAAACSYGPWQVMFAFAAGYTPDELAELEKCAEVFVGYMNRELLTQAPDAAEVPIALAEIAKAYNHGNWRDLFDDSQYVGRLLMRYAQELPE